MSDEKKISDAEYERRLALLKKHEEEEREYFGNIIRSKLSVKGRIKSWLGGEIVDFESGDKPSSDQ